MRLHFPHHIVDIVFPDTSAARPIEINVLATTIAAWTQNGVMDGNEFEKAYRVSLNNKIRASGKFVGYVQ